MNFGSENDYISQFIEPIQNMQKIYQESPCRSQSSIFNKSQILLHKQEDHQSKSDKKTSLKTDRRGKNNKKKISSQATAKYRQKKKKYLQQLQGDVKNLDLEILSTEAQIYEAKDQILKELESLAKVKHSNDNAQIYIEMRNLLNQGEEQESLIDIDKINLLIDTLRCRIGPNGRERQAKINYHFKNIVNTLFPALHRYLMQTATAQYDIFSEGGQNSNLPWTQNLYQQINLSQEQKQKLQILRPKLVQFYQKAHKDIFKLTEIRKQLKIQEVDVEQTEQNIRQFISDIQKAEWILFCQKYKYRKEVQLDRNDYLHEYLHQMEGTNPGRKRLKKQ